MDDKTLIRMLVDEGGFTYESVVLVVLHGCDWTHLRHTGRVKVRLEPPRGEG